ncbi:vacuolar protein sorting-associated protein [Anaeramoeba ignava]|uniref:Vacuolar protein sorting-associated protein n=1 Tax=Anaeramoeba ignava TaxID=1746090 RepID=A0A9Q0LLB0_ANAIG|nr:vacuolar protein sorting-associated protein [Anaeramoeba ignava]
MSFFGSKPVCEVYVAFTDERVRKKITQTIKEQKHQLLVFTSGDSVGGKIKIQVKEGKKLEFEQIKVEFIGQIEVDIFVMNKKSMPDQGNPITMEVGIQDCIHIQFEYRKSKFHLEDVVIGKVFYLLSRIKLKFMEVSVIRREIIGKGEEIDYHNEIVSRFEIMDGTPVKGESIPIRFFLESLDLTPTYKKINNKFSVRYYLKLTLFDEEDKKYFKQSEIFLYRTHFDPFLKSNQN